MKNLSFLWMIVVVTFLLVGQHDVSGFVPPIAPRPQHHKSSFPLHSSTSAASDEDEATLQLERRFQEIATKLRTSVHGGNGFDSRDPKFGVETIRAVIPIEPSLGLELVEVAHSTTDANRGLVLVSGVSGNAAACSSSNKIQLGDTVVGVSCQDYKQSTTGLDYDTTMDAIVQAKMHAQLLQEDSITIQFNRLVQRSPIQVLVVTAAQENGEAPKPILVQGLARDNLRLLLKQNNLYFSTNDCGGEGICGTDMIEILEGEEYVEYLLPGSKKKGRRLQKACQTIVGRDNQECSVKIRLCLDDRDETDELEEGEGDDD